MGRRTVGPSRDAGIALGAANEDEEAVLHAFFRDGRLTEIPTKAGKRRIVLERGRARVRAGEALRRARGERDRRAFFEEHAALRRHLVDEGFLDRKAGVYRRADGRVDV